MDADVVEIIFWCIVLPVCAVVVGFLYDPVVWLFVSSFHLGDYISDTIYYFFT